MDNSDFISSRRQFVGTLTAGAATMLTAMASSAIAAPANPAAEADAEEWLKKIKGKHRIIYDAPEPHDGFPVIWSWVYYKTNNDTGSPDNDLTAMVVLRHNAIPLALEDRLWEKYKLGEAFKITDPVANSPAVRNPYWIPDHGPFKMFGVEGMKRLSERGVMFCVCEMALSVYSLGIAQKMKLDPAEVMKDWVAGVLPGIQIVPSGVWAVGRAQENGCAYCYAGG